MSVPFPLSIVFKQHPEMVDVLFLHLFNTEEEITSLHLISMQIPEINWFSKQSEQIHMFNILKCILQNE